MTREELNKHLVNCKLQRDTIYSGDRLKTSIITIDDVIHWLQDIEVNGITEPKKYNVQVLLCDEGFLNQIVGDKSFCLDSHYEDCSVKTGFTKSEIEEFKKRDDIAIDWDKAVIEPVKED